MGEVVERFRLFPLGIVAIPGEAVPLHIFEERYKTMIDECIELEEPFGIVLLDEGGLREIGCTMRVRELLERFEDGRMNIVCEGERPFRLLRRIDDLPYPAGDVELLDDRVGEPDEELAAAARDRYADLVERVTDERPDPDSLEELDAYGLAAPVEIASDIKQKLLELRGEDERLQLVARFFENALKRVDYAERASERARSNGHLRL